MAILILKFVVFVGFFIGGFLLVRKFVNPSRIEMHNEVAGYIYAVLGVIYGVLLGFVVITVWEEYTDAEKTVNMETSHVMNLYRDANSFPDSIRANMQNGIVNYLNDMVDHEWKAMENLQISEEAKISYLNIWQTYKNYKPADAYENIWYAESVKELNQLAETRRLRINSIYYNIHPFMWAVLFFGAFITTAFSFLFGTTNKILHLIMVFCLSSTICLVLILIEALVQPFSGLIHLTPEPFILALKQLK